VTVLCYVQVGHDSLTTVLCRVQVGYDSPMTVLCCVQVGYDSVAGECRLGTSPPGRPFSSMTAVLDYSTHSHKDVNNMHGGCTAV